MVSVYSVESKNKTSKIALRIKINNKYLFSFFGKNPAKIKCGCCFANAALVIKKTYRFCHFLPPQIKN